MEEKYVYTFLASGELSSSQNSVKLCLSNQSVDLNSGYWVFSIQSCSLTCNKKTIENVVIKSDLCTRFEVDNNISMQNQSPIALFLIEAVQTKKFKSTVEFKKRWNPVTSSKQMCHFNFFSAETLSPLEIDAQITLCIKFQKLK